MDAIYLARDDAHNPDIWSGSPHWIGRTLASSGFNLKYVCPLKGRFRTWYRVKGRLLRSIGYGHTHDGEWPFLKSYAHEAETRLQNARGEILFSCGKPQLVFLETQLPILFFDDGSMPAIIKTHPGHTNFFPPLLRRLFEAERRVLQKCTYACYASDWAADAALEHYGAKFAEKIRVIPFGANMEVRRAASEIERIIAAREPNACNLLFIGRYWDEKGGPIALATAEELHRRGLKVRLDVVGSKPSGAVPPFVHVHGFISKKTAEGQAKLDQLFRSSHLLIVPTRFEAYGLVYVEASSYGLPSLGTAIGGVTTIVRNDANGRTFPLDACASVYADYAQALLKTPTTYQALARSSFREYERRLSWNRWGETVRGLVEPLLTANRRAEPALSK
jgi:glycosyltransferase involved in cell wall biosynthesis